MKDVKQWRYTLNVSDDSRGDPIINVWGGPDCKVEI